MRGFIAELSNGAILKEDTIHTQISRYTSDTRQASARPWILLKRYLQDNPSLKLIALRLQYDHQGIFLPRHAKAYFYSHKVEGYLGGSGKNKSYIGVGATESNSDEVVITWYDGENSTQENRVVDDKSDQFITH